MLQNTAGQKHHVTFDHIKGRENILAGHILWLRFVGLYAVLDPEKRGKESGYFMLDELSPTSVQQERLNTFVI